MPLNNVQNSRLMHHHRYVVIHVLADVSNKARADEADNSKCYRHVVNPRVSFGHGPVCGLQDDVVGVGVREGAGKVTELCILRVGGKDDGFRDDLRVEDVHLCEHGAKPDDLSGFGYQLVVKDVVVNGVANGTSKHTDREGDGCDSRNQVVRADDGGDDGAWNLEKTLVNGWMVQQPVYTYDNAADSNACENDESPHRVQVVWERNSHGSDTFDETLVTSPWNWTRTD